VSIAVTRPVAPAPAKDVNDSVAFVGQRQAEIAIMRLNASDRLATSMHEIIADVLASPIQSSASLRQPKPMRRARHIFLYATHGVDQIN
jgi:hypothetical protein